MKIGILGCGYVGKEAALRWKDIGHSVTAATRQHSRLDELQKVADHVFLLDSSNIGSFLSAQEALLISVAPDKFSDYASTYLKTAQLVTDEVSKLPSLKQILYTSSLSIYGDHGGQWVDENTPPNGQQEQARILLETEKLLLSCANHQLNVCIFRLGEIYGPGREIEKRLERTIHSSFAGNGTAYSNVIHLTDCVNALNFALMRNLHGIYNLCSDFHLPRNLFYQEICQRKNLPPVHWDPNRVSTHQGNKKASNKKIKEEGFHFTHPDYTYQ